MSELLPDCMIGPSEPCAGYSALRAHIEAKEKRIAELEAQKEAQNAALKRSVRGEVYDYEIGKRDAEIARLRPDAERYLYLLSIGMFRCFSPDISGNHTWTGMGRTLPGRGPTVSAAIDAAREQT